MALAQFGDRLVVEGGVVADRGVGAAAGLDADDPVLGEGGLAEEELGVLPRVDVVGDDGQAEAFS
ncbi:MAG: hypothetical protein AVDCRST_MAG19-1991 [uncultured Thermomicrobiales bacterium]|uniref:Uncharacterized protein n=1 Tax=uncultured Thermomicrobiales bacterium TaxID=1645740 RepID=A0A6J4V1Z1_9BACT|nr:MAG: hypothetical protein AVDCRST_MAG19-1991 [uncultured Thermomicrobiales bacterium]